MKKKIITTAILLSAIGALCGLTWLLTTYPQQCFFTMISCVVLCVLAFAWYEIYNSL